MNLEYAAYLLNENQFLTEDANSAGQNGAVQWLQQNYPMGEFGISGDDMAYNEDGTPLMIAGRRGENIHANNAQRIERHAEEFFARPLNRGLQGWAKGLYKFLPGVVRIAITDCGWLTARVNNTKIDRLKDLYIAAYYEWRDGIDEGRQSNGGPYQGLVNKDFVKNNQLGQPVGNPLTFNELNALFGDRVEAAKARLDAQAAAGAQTQQAAAEETEEQRRAREAREEAERIRRSTAGEYHIEYIPNFTVSRTWYEYTNPLSTSVGCHWCITQQESYWNSYLNTWEGGSIYYCWKAESKDALKAMNNDSQWFADWPSDRDAEAPKNGYGLSLICIMVSPDPDGIPRFRQATSRYNHYGPHRNSAGSLYGDNLVRAASGRNDKNERGLREICEILGITETEFFDKFTLRSTNTTVDHTEVVRFLASANLPEKKLYQKLRNDYNVTVSDEYNGFITKICHLREYNFINKTGKLIFSSTWFTDVQTMGDTTPNTFGSTNLYDVYAYQVKFKANGSTVYNLINEYGEFILEQNVASILDKNGNYVKFLVKNDPHLVNVVNIKNKNILLSKPVYDVALFATMGKGIVVKQTESSNYEVVDLKGKKLNTLPFKEIISTSNLKTVKSGRYIPVMTQSNKLCIYDKITSRKILTVPGSNLTFSAIKLITDDFFIFRINDRYKIFYPNGNIALDNIYETNLSSYKIGDQYLLAKPVNQDWGLYDVKDSFNKIVSQPSMDYDAVHRSTYINAGKFYDSDELVCNLYSGTRKFANIISSENVMIRTEDGKYAIYNIPRKEIVCSGIADPHILFNGTNYSVYLGSRKYAIYDEDFNKLAEYGNIASITALTDRLFLCQGYINENANVYNIIGPDGKLLFRLPFKSLLSQFNEDGIAVIEAGNNIYYINIYGDISRTLAPINEVTFIRMKKPVLNEKPPIFRKTNKLLEKAAYLI